MTDPTVAHQPPTEPGQPEPRSLVEQYNIHPVVFALVVLLCIFVTYQVLGGLLTLLIVGGKVTVENVTLHRIFTMGGQILFILVPTIIFSRFFDLRLSRVFPWRVPQIGETVLAVLSLLFLQEILQVYLFFQDRIPLPEELSKIIEPAKRMIEEMFRILVTAQSIPELLFVVLVVSVTPAIIEELLFRGLIQSSFERSISSTKAAIWAGVIFGVFHFNPFAMVPLIMLGIFFGILRTRSQSIILAMTVHFVNNVLAVVVTYFNVDEKLIVEAEKGADANIVFILTQLVLFLLLFGVSFSTYLRFTSRVRTEEKGGK